MFEQIQKRDGTLVPYDKSKITNAILAAAKAQGGNDSILADNLADKVEHALYLLEVQTPSVEEIQDIVEKTLIKEGHAKTAKAYILYRNKRDRVRDANSALMTTIKDLTLKDASDVDLKRENANIDGNSTMGTMLRYGSEASKRFVHLNLLRPEHSEAHLSGLIHIHDLDFYPLTINCIPQDSKIRIKHKDEIKTYTVGGIFNDLFLGKSSHQGINIKPFDFYITSIGGEFTKILNVTRRLLSPNEYIYEISLADGNIVRATNKHLIPILRDNNRQTVHAKNVVIGDKIESVQNMEDEESYKNSRYEEVVDIQVNNSYEGYVFDLETENHHFYADNCLIHNCVQIDLEKLFEKGYSTGYGKLREPGDIRSYGALAAIAVQSSQNDMFKQN